MYQDNNVFSERKWGDPVRVKASFNSHSKVVSSIPHLIAECLSPREFLFS